MRKIQEVSRPGRYFAAERNAARLTLARSRFFLILGLGTQMGDEQNPIPPTICTCSTPKALFKVIKLQSKNKELSRDTNARICIESKGRHSPRGYISSASRIGSAVGALFTFVHHTNYQDIV